MPKSSCIADAPLTHPALPFLCNDQGNYINRDYVIVERVFCGYQGVCYFFHEPDIPVLVCTVLDSTVGRKHHIKHATLSEVKTALGPIRSAALVRGATPEAVRLIHGILPFSNEELQIMSNKLKSKGEGKATASKAAKADKPVKAEKAKSNPDALEKARDAGPDVRKITVLKKENPYREGTKRANSFDALKGAKTVEEYKAAGGAVKYISRWESEGIIKVA